MMSVNKCRMIFCVVSVITIVVLLVFNAKATTDSLADKVIRFHVVANSDTTEDQILKQRVKDEIIEYMEPMLKDSASLDETRKILNRSLPIIKQIAQNVIGDYEKNYSVYVSLDHANFPIKSYGDVIFPSGEYEACRVIIGEGKGENWWCVMYPPLCYVDAASGVVPLEGKEQLKQKLNEDQYKLVLNKSEKRYEVRFKIVDTINSYFCKDNYKSKR